MIYQKQTNQKIVKLFFLILLNHKLNFQAKLQVIKTMTSVDSGQHIWNSACGLLTHFTWTLMEWSYHHCYSFFSCAFPALTSQNVCIKSSSCNKDFFFSQQTFWHVTVATTDENKKMNNGWIPFSFINVSLDRFIEISHCKQYKWHLCFSYDKPK